MLIKRIFINNALRNFNYLIICPHTHEALAIDPLDAEQLYKIAQENNANITKIFNTHEHADHTAGNIPLQKLTNADIYAHYKNINHIPHATHPLHAGDILTVGNIEINCLDTPGHTFAHICLLTKTDPPALFCGDTLFNAGVGNCYSGDPKIMYQTVVQQIDKIPDNTQIYPGHDYLENNLRFTLDINPDNIMAQKLLAENKNIRAEDRLITTMALEKQINLFLNIDPQDPAAQEKFLHLRKLRDKW
jgi:hydroxyacylglutathione hydrolase